MGGAISTNSISCVLLFTYLIPCSARSRTPGCRDSYFIRVNIPIIAYIPRDSVTNFLTSDFFMNHLPPGLPMLPIELICFFFLSKIRATICKVKGLGDRFQKFGQKGTNLV
jgi:hypothetical protein